MPQFAERIPVAERRPTGTIARQPTASPETRPVQSIARSRVVEPASTPASQAVAGLPPRLRSGVEALSGIAMDDVRVHRNSSEPAKLGALAFTRGAEIHLAPGQEEHLTHEAWHVVQQKQGRVQATTQKGRAVNEESALELEADKMGAVAERGGPRGAGERRPLHVAPASLVSTIQCRRIPGAADLTNELPATEPGFSIARAGLARALGRAWIELPASQRFGMTTTPMMVGTSQEELVAALGVATRTQIIDFANELRRINPTTELGDISQTKAPARPGTSDAANLRILVEEADKRVYQQILGGGRDADLRQVFGSRFVAAAKRRYGEAKKAGASIVRRNRVTSDRSGLTEEVGLGGYYVSGRIHVLAEIIDDPRANDSITTFIHESVHAGNADIGDDVYVQEPMFTKASEHVKINNAAHFQVVPQRILDDRNKFAFAGQVFTPAGRAHPATANEHAAKAARDILNKAWYAGVFVVHEEIMAAARNPSKWYSSSTVRRRLTKWSTIERLTIHQRISDIPSVLTATAPPVTHIDVALSEGIARGLSNAGFNLPGEPADALAFVDRDATPAEKAAVAAASNPLEAERDLLIALALRKGGQSLVGMPVEDRQVVDGLAAESP